MPTEFMGDDVEQALSSLFWTVSISTVLKDPRARSHAPKLNKLFTALKEQYFGSATSELNAYAVKFNLEFIVEYLKAIQHWESHLNYSEVQTDALLNDMKRRLITLYKGSFKLI
jgi:hypothetical protein